jgi:hypothetical protein
MGHLKHEILANILNLLRDTIVWTKVQFKTSTKKFEKNLKAYLGNGRIVTAFGELIADKSICFPQRQPCFFADNGNTYAAHQQLHTN